MVQLTPGAVVALRRGIRLPSPLYVKVTQLVNRGGEALWSRKAALRSDDGPDSVPARFDAALWPRLDRGALADGQVLRLDTYRLKGAADGHGDWWVIIVAATVMRPGEGEIDDQAPDDATAAAVSLPAPVRALAAPQAVAVRAPVAVVVNPGRFGKGQAKSKVKTGLCDNCGDTSSPQWRRGPPEKPSLCNACGVRFKHAGEAGLLRSGRAVAGSCAPKGDAAAASDAPPPPDGAQAAAPQPRAIAPPLPKRERPPTRPAAAGAAAAAAAAGAPLRGTWPPQQLAQHAAAAAAAALSEGVGVRGVGDGSGQVPWTGHLTSGSSGLLVNPKNIPRCCYRVECALSRRYLVADDPGSAEFTGFGHNCATCRGCGALKPKERGGWPRATWTYDMRCERCKSADDRVYEIVVCDICGRGFHTRCAGLAAHPGAEVPWACPDRPECLMTLHGGEGPPAWLLEEGATVATASGVGIAPMPPLAAAQHLPRAAAPMPAARRAVDAAASAREAQALAALPPPLAPTLCACDCHHCALPKLRKRCLRLLAHEGHVGCDVALAGWAAVGLDVEVLWPRDEAFYLARISAYDPSQRAHTLRYFVDGESELRRLWTDSLRWPSQTGAHSLPAADAQTAHAAGPPPGWAAVRAARGASERAAAAAQPPQQPPKRPFADAYHAVDAAPQQPFHLGVSDDAGGAGKRFKHTYILGSGGWGHLPAEQPSPGQGGHNNQQGNSLSAPATVSPPASGSPGFPPAAGDARHVISQRGTPPPPSVDGWMPTAAAHREVPPAAPHPPISSLVPLRDALLELPTGPPPIDYWRSMKRFLSRGVSRDDMERTVYPLLAPSARPAHSAFVAAALASNAHKVSAAAMVVGALEGFSAREQPRKAPLSEQDQEERSLRAAQAARERAQQRAREAAAEEALAAAEEQAALQRVEARRRSQLAAAEGQVDGGSLPAADTAQEMDWARAREAAAEDARAIADEQTARQRDEARRRSQKATRRLHPEPAWSEGELEGLQEGSLAAADTAQEMQQQ